MRKFTALYTHQKLKKAKTWQDGFAHYNGEAHEIVLFDANNGRLTSHRLRAKETIELSIEYDVGRFLLTLEEEEHGGDGVSPVEQPSVALQVRASNSLRSIRRTKRPASLIKPVKVKGTAPVSVEAAQAPAVDPQPTTVAPQTAKPDDGADRIEYTVLFTTQKTKKLKEWSDGELAFSPTDRRIALKGEDGSTIISMRIPGKTAVEVGNEIDCGRYLVQIECLKGQDAAAVTESTVPAGLQLQGALKRRHEKLHAPKSRPVVTSSGLKPVKLKKTVSNADSTAAKRAKFVPPVPNVPKHLHFPRRGELLQHVSVSKGYGLGPPRKLAAPVKYKEWAEYKVQFAELLRENLTVELSALAIRYYFMARERFEGRTKGSLAKKGFAQVCKSVGVLFFEGCTVRQPFMDSAAFKAQRDKGAVTFSKGDSVSLELSRREAYAGYAKDDTWAISTSEDFPLDETFLARSAYFGPNKNNVLELVLVGEEDAKAASRIFSAGGSQQLGAKRGARYERAAPTVVAIHCLDTASDWSMIDTVEEQLCPETLPYLPHLLDMSNLPLAAPNSCDVDVEAVLGRINGIVAACRTQLNLNDEQYGILKEVVSSAVSIYLPIPDAASTTIVHGPFGTGKSFLIAAITTCLDDIAYEFPEVFGGGSVKDSDIEIIGDTEPKEPQHPPLKVLLSSMTNFAVDNMLSALLKQGYDRFLRVGSLRRVSKQILPYVYRSSASASDDIRELELMLEAASDPTEQDVIATALQRIRQQNVHSTLADTLVVGTTCLSAAAATLRGTQFPVVILDEACQIVEPMALIALANAGCQRLVLVGDPLQLPPTLTTRATRDAEGRGLDRALFDRLVQMGHQPRFLSTQYRCHPRIGSLCNQLFYQGRLSHGIGPESRPALVPALPSLAFLDTPGQEKQNGKSQSFFNQGEIDMAVQLTSRLLQMDGIEPESVGVIALYKMQADMLRDRLADVLGQRSRVQVSTVDAYQGSERDIIIISCVRTEKIGFIANPNRVNVALSRARHHCLVLGCRRLLQTNGMWRSIIEYCRGDTGNGLISAQVLVNQVAEAVVQQADGEASVLVDVEQQFCQSQPHDTCSVDGDVAIVDLPAILPASERTSELDNDSDFGEHDDTERFAGEEGVVGGFLSQWSHASFGGSSSESDQDDILGCLEVDLDEM